MMTRKQVEAALAWYSKGGSNAEVPNLCETLTEAVRLLRGDHDHDYPDCEICQFLRKYESEP